MFNFLTPGNMWVIVFPDVGIVCTFMVVGNKSFWTVSVKYNPYLTSSINQVLPFSKKTTWQKFVWQPNSWTIRLCRELCNAVQDKILLHIRTPLIRINWDGEPSGYAEKPDNWIFLWKWATLAVWSSAVAIYHMYPRLNLSTKLDLKSLKP